MSGVLNWATISNDGRWLVAPVNEQQVEVHDLQRGKVVHTFPGFYPSKFSPDATLLATVVPPSQVHLRDLRTGKLRAVLAGHHREVMGLAFSPDGRRLATSSPDQLIILWDTIGGQTRRKLVGHSGHAGDIAFSPDGLRLASTGTDRGVKLWSISGGEPIRTIAASQQLHCVCYCRQGAWLASGGSDGRVEIRDVATGDVLKTLQGHAGAIRTMAASDSKALLATGSADATVRVWDLASGKTLHKWRDRSDQIGSLAFSTDGSYLAYSQGEAVNVREVSGQGRWILAGHRDLVRGLCFSPDGGRVASASNDYTVRIWDWRRQETALVLRASGGGWFCSVAYSPDGKVLVSGSGYQVLTVWNSSNGKELHKINAHVADVGGLAFTPDGRRLFSASADNTLKIWDTSSWRVVRTLRGQGRSLSWPVVAVHPDGARLACVSGGPTICLYDGRPVSAEVEVDREALGLIDSLLEQPLLKEDACEEVRKSKVIAEKVRSRALELLETCHDHGDRFNQASWLAVRRSDLNEEEYRAALQHAETACGLEPQSGECRNTLGVAQYRVQKYDEAIVSLEESMQLLEERGVVNLLFLAMCHFKLGNLAQARKHLDEAEASREPDAPPSTYALQEYESFHSEAAALLSAHGSEPSPKPVPTDAEEGGRPVQQ